MKPFLAFLLTCLSYSLTIAQYREEYGEHELRYVQQSDSIYRAAKVRVRRAYNASGYPAKKKLLAEYVFDVAGRIIQIQYEAYTGGQIRTCYFSYQADGNLATMQDVLVKGAPNPGLKELIGEKEYQQQLKAIPDKVEYAYAIQYNGDSLISLVATDATGERIRESLFSGGGSTHAYQKFTGALFRSTTRYLNHRNYRFLPVTIVSVFNDLPPSESRFEYTFDNNDRLVERIEYKKNYEPIHVQFTHNKKGLLSSAGQDGQDVIFEYEFWR